MSQGKFKKKNKSPFNTGRENHHKLPAIIYSIKPKLKNGHRDHGKVKVLGVPECSESRNMLEDPRMFRIYKFYTKKYNKLKWHVIAFYSQISSPVLFFMSYMILSTLHIINDNIIQMVKSTW